MDQMDLIYNYRAFHLTVVEHTFFSSVHEICFRIGDMQGHKGSLSNLKKIEEKVSGKNEIVKILKEVKINNFSELKNWVLKKITAIREMQTKTAMRFPFTLDIRKSNANLVSMGMLTKSTIWKIVYKFLRNLQTDLPQDPTFSLLECIQMK